MHTYVNTAQDDTQDYSAQKIASTCQIVASLNRCMLILQPIQNKSNCTITTPIDSDALAKYLEGYDLELAQFLVTGFSLGFRIPYEGERNFRLSNYLPSFEKNKSVGLQRISQELCTGRIAGPFFISPLTKSQLSPLGIVPKNNPGEFRMIHHLTYPKGSSINDHIPAQYCSIQYQSIDHAIAAIKQIGVGLFCQSQISKMLITSTHSP